MTAHRTGISHIDKMEDNCWYASAKQSVYAVIDTRTNLESRRVVKYHPLHNLPLL
jgi:hypothetical protein